MKRFIGGGMQTLLKYFGCVKTGFVALACFALIGGAALAQPANDVSTNAFILAGATGSTNGSNVGATIDDCEPNSINFDDYADLDNSVWFAWTAPTSGTVEFDTVGSAFNTVLAVYTTPTTNCDPEAVQIDGGNDDLPGATETNAQVSFSVTAGTTYYISVNGNADVGAPYDSGNYVLNWSMSGIPSIASGSLGFVSSSFVAAATDSGAPNIRDGAVSLHTPVVGARVTVTRAGAFSGRVLLDYVTSPALYTNTFSTNWYGTNIISQFVGTNGVFITNSTVATMFVVHKYQYYYNGGFTRYNVTNAFTNNLVYIENEPTNGPITLITNISGYLPYTPLPTNNPPLNLTTNVVYFPGTYVSQTQPDTNTTITIITNIFELPSVRTNYVIPSVPASFTPTTGTLAFDDYQMSGDLGIPVSGGGPAMDPTSGPGGETPGLPTLINITLSNVRLDPSESSDLQPPILTTSNAIINVLSMSLGAQGVGAAGASGPGTYGDTNSIINFERSTFGVYRSDGTATISVLRSGGSGNQSVSAEYVIDPTLPAPENGYQPINSFPLEPGSDYAQPNVDYTPVNGTLTWGANDPDPKTFSVPIINTTALTFNEDMLLELYNPTAPPAYTDIGEVNRAYLTIYNFNQPAGAADVTWNNDGSPNSNPPYLTHPGTAGNGGTVYALAEQNDGKTIAAGSFTSFDSQSYNRIVRLLSNGYQDTTFLAAPNSGANDFISSVVLYSSSSANYGKMIIAGNFTSFNGTNRYHIARLNSDGSLDVTFNPGSGANGTVWAVAIATNDQIVVGGQFTSYNGTNIAEVARLNTDGSLDTTFNPGSGPDGAVNALALDSSGNVIIGGAFDTVAGTSSGGVARLNATGVLDMSFAPGIGTYNPVSEQIDPVNAVVVQPNGQILIGGSFAYMQLSGYNGIVRLNTDGSVDPTFQPGTGTLNPFTASADSVNSITLQPDGNIIIGGDFEAFNQTRRFGIARLYGADGTVDTSFMDNAYNQFAGVPNLYHNSDAVNETLYPPTNERNVIYALGVEMGTTNILIGGNFLSVGAGGGGIDTAANILPIVQAAEGGTRAAMKPRSNVARLVGGATPGPGNIEFTQTSYSASKSTSPLFVSMTRTNGNLGAAGVTFATNTAAAGPGIASGNDFSVLDSNPIWPTTYSLSDLSPTWYNYIGEYGPNYDTISWGTNDTEPFVYVQINSSTNITGNLSANFTLTNPLSAFYLGGEPIALGVALGAQSTAPLTILDDADSSGVIAFSVTNYSVVGTSGAKATITLTRTGGSDNPVTVTYYTTNGVPPNAATNNVDFTAESGTIAFGIGVTTGSFTVPIIYKSGVTPDKNFRIVLANPTGGATLGQANATVTIINGNYTPGHVSFSQPVYSTNENAGVALITVQRLGGSTGVLNVNLSTSSGSAVNGKNYIGTNVVLSWSNGNATPQVIAIPVIDDGLVTTNLTVNLALTNANINNTVTNANLLGLSQYTNATLFINNVDSYGTIQFSSASYSVKKSGGFALVPVVRTGGSAQTVSVSFTTVDGTATAGANYVAATNTLVFTNGQVAQYVQVPIINDNIADGLKYLTLALSNFNPTNTLGAPATATLNIIDTDTINEIPGSGDATFSPSAGFNNSVFALTFENGNQLLAGGDFTMADGVLRNHIARLNTDGTLDASFSLPASSYGANGSIRSIAVQSDGRILVGGLFNTFNSVVMNHFARLNPNGTLDSLFNPGSGADSYVYAIAETFVNGQSESLLGGAFATINGQTFNGVARLNYDGTPDTNFNFGGLGANGIVYSLAVYPTNSANAGKILIGGSFTTYNGNTNYAHIARLNPNGSLDQTFNIQGVGPNDSVQAIALQLDGQILIGGVFTNVNGLTYNHLARLNANGALDTSFQSGIGANDTVFSIAVQSDSRILVGGEFSLFGGVTRNGITRLNPNGSVDPTINFGTGANNFVAAVLVKEDTLSGYPTNVPDEKIIIGGGFTQYNGLTNDYLAQIYGGSITGSGAFQFPSANYQVDESGSNIIITVVRTGGTAGPNADGTGDVLVPFATSNYTAIAGVNYGSVVTNLDFPEGEVQKSVVIPIYDDGVVTPNLLVNLYLFDPLTDPNPPSEVGNQPTALLTIINDDSTISFSSTTYSVAKNNVSGVAAINVVRTGGTNGTSTVSFNTTTNGTAVVGTDYTPVSQTVTFAPGVSSVVVPVPITNNAIVEPNQTVDLQLTNAIGSTLVNPSNAVLTIINTVNAPGQVSFTATNYTVTTSSSPGSSTVYLSVGRGFGSSGIVSVQFATTNGSALSGINYVGTNGVLTFADGQTNATFAVQIINTATAYVPTTFSVLLSNPTGGASLVAPTNASVTILNNNIGIGFTAATNTVTDTAAFVQVNVQRVGNTNGTVTINYATTNGTAVSNVDYQAMSGTLTFAPGQSSIAITVPLFDDTNNTGNLYFTMGLSNPSSGQLLAQSMTTIVLQGANAGFSFTNANTTVLKNAGSALITVICANSGIIGSNGVPLQVSYSTANGSAIAGVDYVATSGTLIFSNNVGTNTFSVPIINNGLVTTNKSFTVSLSNPVSPGELANPSTQTVTIIDTVSGIEFSSATYTAQKTSGFANITVYRTTYTNSTVSVNFSATNSTAVNGVNFVATNGVLVFTNGVTSQTFQVPIIDTTVVQPDLTVLLQLSNPSGGASLVAPSSAVLTIHDNTGSYVVPVASYLQWSTGPDYTNGIIDPNTTNIVQFAFRDGGGTNVNNLIAVLIATNGITPMTATNGAPLSYATNSYGTLVYSGHSVSEPYTFSVRGTNTQLVTANFQLQSGTNVIGTAAFGFTLGSWTTTFANTNVIVINDNTNASPYPSLINVSGLGSSLVRSTVTISNLWHTYVHDVDALVVSPAGLDTLLMAHTGGGYGVTNVTLTFSDAVTNSLPNFGQIVSGTNKPTQFYPVRNFP